MSRDRLEILKEYVEKDGPVDWDKPVDEKMVLALIVQELEYLRGEVQEITGAFNALANWNR